MAAALAAIEHVYRPAAQGLVCGWLARQYLHEPSSWAVNAGGSVPQVEDFAYEIYGQLKRFEPAQFALCEIECHSCCCQLLHPIKEPKVEVFLCVQGSFFVLEFKHHRWAAAECILPPQPWTLHNPASCCIYNKCGFIGLSKCTWRFTLVTWQGCTENIDLGKESCPEVVKSAGVGWQRYACNCRQTLAWIFAQTADSLSIWTKCKDVPVSTTVPLLLAMRWWLSVPTQRVANRAGH